MGEWEKKRLKKFVKFVFEKFSFVKHLKSWTYISYHKNRFSNSSIEKNFQIFQNLSFFRIRPIELIFWPIKKGREKFSFQLKSRVSSIPSRFLLSRFRFLPDTFWPIKFWIFKIYRNQIRFFKQFFVFLSDSSHEPFSQIFFFLSFFWSKL